MNQPAGRPERSRALVAFFVLCYVTNGLGDYDNGLLIQPLTFYLKQALGWNSDQAATYLGALALPWMITPLYSAFCEFVPLFGLRHKSYIILANALLVAAYLALARLTDADLMLVALLASAVTTAVSTTLCSAIMVASSKKMSGGQTFVDIQWTCYYAGIAAANFAGGWLAQQLAPASAFHAAAAIMLLAPLAVLAGALLLPKERKTRVDLPGFKASLAAMRSTFKVRVLWMMGLFLALFNFCPGFQTPLYYQMVDHLGFSQQFTGAMSAFMAVGSVIGGIICALLEKRVSLKTMLYLGIVFGVLAQGAYVFLSSPTSAVILSLCYGSSQMLSLVAALTLAARYCPDGAEGFAYAILVCVSNASYQLSDQIGSVLYKHVFSHSLTPLIIVTCLFTAAAAGVLPLLKRHDDASQN